MNAQQIRCENDLRLFEMLSNHQDVKSANEAIAKQIEDGTTTFRRRLLATSVRLSRRMAKTVHRMADECTEKLELDIPLELFVFSSPQYNAACLKPENGRLIIMFSSSLLEHFTGSELRFVVGHELGHHLYRHHDIPIGYLLQGKAKPNPRFALELFAWSRYAEISADRAGAHCAQDLSSVAKALFKLASGLGDKTIEFNLDDFLQQVDDMQITDSQPGNSAPSEDWFSTHPFSPLRVKALELFDRSELAMHGGISKAELEVAVQRVMSLMEPSYLEGKTKTAELMRRALFAGAIVVAEASGDISEEEIAVFEKFFGSGSYSENLNVEKLRSELSTRLAEVKAHASMTERMQLIHDLCIISQAEGHNNIAERKVLDDIAGQLEVAKTFICQTMDVAVELD